MATENAFAVHVKSRSAVGSAVTITPGTDPGLRVLERPTPTPIGTGLIDRTDASSPEAPGLRPVKGSRGWEVTLRTEVYGFVDLDDYTTTGYGPLWAGAGVVTEGASTLTWQPTRAMGRVGSDSASTGLVPFDVLIDHIGGNQYRLNNCLATVEISADGGNRLFATWTIRGEYVAPAKSTLAYGTTTYDAQAPIVMNGATAADDLANYDAISRWSLTMGVELTDHPNGLAAEGMNGPLLSWVAPPMLSFSADSADETAESAWADAYSVTQKALEVEIGASPNAIKITMDPAFASAPPVVAGDSFGVYEHAFMAEGTGLTLEWS